MFAVSQNVMPSSTACRKNGCGRVLVQGPRCSPRARVAEAHAAQRDPADPQPGAAEAGVLHGMSLSFGWGGVGLELPGRAASRRVDGGSWLAVQLDEQPQVRLRHRPRLGAIDDESQPGLGRQLGDLVLQRQVPDGNWRNAFAPDGVLTDSWAAQRRRNHCYESEARR